jgi:hypothetical protein
MTTRRNFLGLMGAGAAVPMLHQSIAAADYPAPISADWDMSWVEKVKGQHRAVFDAPELSSGLPLLRANLWGKQYAEVYGAKPGDVSPVLVLRHTAFAFAMDDATWNRFELAKQHNLGLFHGAAASPGNPMRTTRADVAEPFRSMNLEQFQKDGGIVLGCNLAFSFEIVPKFKAAGMTDEAARAEALTHLLPGVILQPSGFFAISRAQEAGCQFVPAS